MVRQLVAGGLLCPLLLALGALACAGGGPGAAVEAGRALYLKRGCASCHGPAGGGDGPVARGLPRPPRDLRLPSSFTRGASAEAIANVIAEGIAGGMPAHPFIPPAERREIALYILSLSRSAATNPAP